MFCLFIGAWATTKIPLIMFETATLGFRFMMLRLTCNIIGIIVIRKIRKDTKKGSRAMTRQLAQRFWRSKQKLP